MMHTTRFIMSSLEETEGLARQLTPLLKAGDILALEGDLGAGKSAFARAVIRDYFAAPDMEVPSPTFTIVQSYEDAVPGSNKAAIWHADLYRLADPDELYELGLEDALDDCVMLIEWPDRLDKALRDKALTLKFECLPAADDVEELPRAITLCMPPAWTERLHSIEANI